MKTRHSRKPKRRVMPRLGNKYYYHYKLQKIDQIDCFIGMIRSYILEFEVRQLLVCACMGHVHDSERWDLFNPERRCFIALSDKIHLDKDVPKGIMNFRKEVAVSLFHELIHVEIHHVFKITNSWDHNEKLIEETSKIWADRFPEIIDVFEDIFDCDLSPDQEGRLKRGKYFQALHTRPIHFQLELFDRRRLMPYEPAPIIFE